MTLSAAPEPAGRDDLAAFVAPFTRYLKAEAKAPGTITKYLTALRTFEAWLSAGGYSVNVAEIQKRHVQEFMAASLEKVKSSTANSRFYSLKAFFNFLMEDEEIRWHPMEGMSPPPAPAPPVALVSGDFVQALLKTCKGSSFEDRRDAALIMMLLDTGGRVSEIVRLTLDDVGDGSAGVIGKASAKGGGPRPRTVHYGPTTARALDRYLRVRDRHVFAGRPELWVGRQGPTTRWGVRDILDRRCDLAGLAHIHPHQFRHTAAHEWLADGGEENDLMRLMGWSSRTMVGRYAASAADARAAANYKKRQSPVDKLKGSK